MTVPAWEWQHRPYVSLGCRRSDRVDCARELIGELIGRGLWLVFVVTRPPLRHRLRRFSLRVVVGEGFRAYKVAESREVEEAVRLLVGMGLWHGTIFSVLIGGSGSREQAVQVWSRCLRPSLKYLEQDLAPYMVGYIQPLDDELECYGDELVRDAIGSLRLWRKEEI